jgi:hypothetical protein
LIQELAERLVWVAPVGVHPGWNFKTGYNDTGPLRGFMVCKRSVNNVDNGSSRVDYLMVDGGWKKPFAEDRNMFPTLDAALEAAAKAVGIA